MVHRVSDILPTEGSVGAYKLAKLRALLGAGIVIDFAYGNATTDIYAYLGNGVPADRVWIIGSHAGEQGTHAVEVDRANAPWRTMSEIRTLPWTRSRTDVGHQPAGFAATSRPRVRPARVRSRSGSLALPM